MRYLRYIFWGIVAICLIVIGLANAQMVPLRALPVPLADLVGVSPVVEVPLFVVIFLGVALGLLIGFLWEWLREYKHRHEASRQRREKKILEREVTRLKSEKHQGQDEVLAMLE